MADSPQPRYISLALELRRQIDSGSLTPGSRLPSIRQLAEEQDCAPGTVRRAYEFLTEQGIVETKQGSGSYVRSNNGPDSAPAFSREQAALTAIDRTLDHLSDLGFSTEDSGRLIELKLRERSGPHPLRIGIIDCNPESRREIAAQLNQIVNNISIREYSLESVEQRPQIVDPGLDMVLTTTTHFEDLRPLLAADVNLVQLVLTPSQATLLAISRIPAEARVIYYAESRIFARIMEKTRLNSVAPDSPVVGEGRQRFFGRETETIDADYVVLPVSWGGFARKADEQFIRDFSKQGELVTFAYTLDHGSRVYLSQQFQTLEEAGGQQNE